MRGVGGGRVNNDGTASNLIHKLPLPFLASERNLDTLELSLHRGESHSTECLLLHMYNTHNCDIRCSGLAAHC